MAEITLVEAKELLKKSAEMKNFLLTKFTKEELEGKPVPSQEEFNKYFDSIIKDLNVKFITHSNIQFPTNRYTLTDTSGNWFFEICTGKSPYFAVNYDRVCLPINAKYGINLEQIIELMKDRVHNVLHLKGITPTVKLLGVFNRHLMDAMSELGIKDTMGKND